MAATRTIGHMQEFAPENESVTAYLERFQLFVAANAIDDDKLVPTLLTVVGSAHYSLIRGLVAPELPKNKTYDELVDLLKKHYDPEPIIIAERFHFYQRSQKANESIANYLANLRRLASRCEFGDFLADALRDRLVCGMSNCNIQKVLLTKAKLTLEKAVEVSQGMEAAAEKAKELTDGRRPNPVLNVHTPVRPAGSGGTCSRCGRSNHDKRECKFRNATCHKCGKVGHLAPACRSSGKPAGGGKLHRGPDKKTKWLGVDPSPDSRADLTTPTTTTTTTPLEATEHLFVIKDKTSPPYLVSLKVNGQPLTMEVDTGAAVSLATESAVEALLPSVQLQPSNITLKTYTGETIPVKGTLSVDVDYEQHVYRGLKLLIVQGAGPSLLGRDWLRIVRLDWRNIAKVARVSPSSSLENRVAVLRDRYREVFSESLGTITPFQAKLSVTDGARPKFFKPRPVPFALRERVEQELDRLERDGVLERTHYSEWAAPIVAVPKADGKIRLCGDYKVTINPVLDVDQYPLPKPEDIFATLSGGQHFTTLDLTHAYNQLLLDEESRKFVTVNTHKGLYQYTRLPFGIASAPAVFQRTMDTILQGIDGTACYIDDIIVTGKSDDEHLAHLEEVLKRLQRHGVHVNQAKCRFLQASVIFLGHRIDSDGIHPTDEKLAAITQAPAPENVQELRSFLGLINYYGKFIPNAATLLAPLNELLRKDAKWKWTQRCQSSFEQAKQTLMSSEVLIHYNPALPIRLAGDASAYGIGAVIAHVFPDGSERPVAFASRTLTQSERNYAQVEKEALSLIFGVKHFHSYLYGRKFEIITDHKPLMAILGEKRGIPPLAAARLQRWAWILSAYKYEIQFRPTGDHGNADGLSRLPRQGVTPESTSADPKIFNVSQIDALPVTVRQLRAATRADRSLSKVIRYTQSGWPGQVPLKLKPFADRRNELTVEEGCLLWGYRVLIPEKLRRKLLQELHRDHPGVVRMKAIARSYMWWPGLDREIEQAAKGCQPCQAVKRAPLKSPLHPWVWPDKPWQRVHLDFAGPFQGSMFLVAVDAYSKWPEVRAMTSTTVTATLNVLRQWFCAHGIPEQLVTDNGPQFTADAFKHFTEMNGIRHTRCAPYHPASNGLAERFVQSFKQSLKASVNDGRSLTQRLSSFLLTYRTTAHATTGVPPCKLLTGREFRTRLSLLRPDVGKFVRDRQDAQKVSHDRRVRDRSFVVGDRVLARNLRPGPDWIPGTIVEVLGPVTYIVEVDGGQRWKRHIEQLKDWLAPIVGNRPSSEEPRNEREIVDPDLVEPVEETRDPPNDALDPLNETPDTQDETPDNSDETPSAVERPPTEQLPANAEPAERRYPSRNRRPPEYYS